MTLNEIHEKYTTMEALYKRCAELLGPSPTIVLRKGDEYIAFLGRNDGRGAVPYGKGKSRVGFRDALANALHSLHKERRCQYVAVRPDELGMPVEVHCEEIAHWRTSELLDVCTKHAAEEMKCSVITSFARLPEVE